MINDKGAEISECESIVNEMNAKIACTAYSNENINCDLLLI